MTYEFQLFLYLDSLVNFYGNIGKVMISLVCNLLLLHILFYTMKKNILLLLNYKW